MFVSGIFMRLKNERPFYFARQIILKHKFTILLVDQEFSSKLTISGEGGVLLVERERESLIPT